MTTLARTQLPDGFVEASRLKDYALHQVWYDDADSVLMKADLVEINELGGIGFWALNYDGNDPKNSFMTFAGTK